MDWKPIVGFDDYEVSDAGQVRFIGGWRSFGCQERYVPATERKLAIKSNGYVQVTIYNENGPSNKYVHRLVAGAFIPNPNNLPEVNHLDGDKRNNQQGNLEWCSFKGNKEHAREFLGVDVRGERHGMAKITEAKALEIIKSDATDQEIAYSLGLSRQHINNIRSGKSWPHLQAARIR